MTLPILSYPDKRLRTKATIVKQVDKKICALVKDMFATMYEADGVGLAATQVDFHQRIVVIDVSKEKNQPLCLINPKIIKKSGCLKHEEGCLSVPNYSEFVTRADNIEVEALNEGGDFFKISADGLLSICIQHEIDHLDGILFIDYLSNLKQKRLLAKIKKSKI